jgi:hypothetical protein
MYGKLGSTLKLIQVAKVCFTNTLENLIHPLWGFPLLYKLYRSSLFMSLIYRFHSKPQNSGKWKMFTTKQFLFNSILFKKINKFHNVWATFWRITIWLIWVEDNEYVLKTIGCNGFRKVNDSWKNQSMWEDYMEHDSYVGQKNFKRRNPSSMLNQ